MAAPKDFIFLTEDDPPLAGGLTAYRFFWQTRDRVGRENPSTKYVSGILS